MRVFTVNQAPIDLNQHSEEMPDKISFRDDPVAYRQALAMAIE